MESFSCQYTVLLPRRFPTVTQASRLLWLLPQQKVEQVLFEMPPPKAASYLTGVEATRNDLAADDLEPSHHLKH